MVRRLVPLLLLFVLAFAPAGAQTNDTNETSEGNETPEGDETVQEEPAGPEAVAISLIGVQEGAATYFQLEGQTQRNPDLIVPPGATVTVTFHSQAGVHNFHPDGMAASDYVADGETTTYTFTAPQSGTLAYWCDPHKTSGMQGKIVVGTGAAPGGAAPEAPTEYTLVGVQEGSSFYFHLEGQTQRNPQLLVPANQEITITLKSAAGVHNFHVDGVTPSEYVSDGETTTIKFTSPASGTLAYWCDPHKGSGMQGTVKVATAGDAGGQDGGGVPGDCEIPAAAQAGFVGGPTVKDYEDKCRGVGTAAATETDPYAFADYVIPAFWGLIGIGVLGAVWVHRKYNP